MHRIELVLLQDGRSPGKFGRVIIDATVVCYNRCCGFNIYMRYILAAGGFLMYTELDETEWNNIERSLNVTELAPKRIACGLLTLGDSVDDTPRSRSQFIHDIRSGGDTKFRLFLSCFDPEEYCEHMGHSYIACLLHGKQFANQRTVHLSSEYKRVFTTSMTSVVDLMDLKYLLPYLLQARLLTLDEASSFSKNEAKVNILRLFYLIESKGPIAHHILVKCIGEKKQHIGHSELYKLITEEYQSSLPSPKHTKPAELSCESTLTCQGYHDRRHKFEKYYHSGQWNKVAELSRECMKSSVIEVQVIGCLELALSYIFRIREQEVLQYVLQAEALCKRIENSNRTFLCGRCKYLLALLYYYMDKTVRAKKYIMEAKDILFGVEVGEDKSFAMYCDAVISASTLTDKSSSFDFSLVTSKFKTALSYSQQTYDMDILVIYSFLRLSRLYLGRTDMKLTKCTDEIRIQNSKDCQQKLKKDYYSQMDTRCMGLYYLNQCDIHMSTGESTLAVSAAKQAQYFAKESGCTMDIQAVKLRLQALTLT